MFWKNYCFWSRFLIQMLRVGYLQIIGECSGGCESVIIHIDIIMIWILRGKVSYEYHRLKAQCLVPKQGWWISHSIYPILIRNTLTVCLHLIPWWKAFEILFQLKNLSNKKSTNKQIKKLHWHDFSFKNLPVFASFQSPTDAYIIKNWKHGRVRHTAAIPGGKERERGGCFNIFVEIKFNQLREAIRKFSHRGNTDSLDVCR